MTGSLAVRGARIVDVLTGAVSVPSRITMRDGRIDAVVAESSHRDIGTRVDELDVAGGFVIPGVVTVHTHLSIVFPFADTDEAEDPALTAFRSASRAWDALRAGATTIRCIHEQHRVDLRLREASQRGWFRGPRVRAGGRALGVPGGHGQGTGAVLVSGPDAFYDAALAELDAGADHIKVFITGGIAHQGERPADPEMSYAEMAAVVRAAARYDSYVVAHAGHSTAIGWALDAGVLSFEHAYLVDQPTAERLAAPGVFVSPTLIVTHSLDTMRANGFAEHSMANARAAAAEHLNSCQRLIAAGVTLTHGTDYPPGQLVNGVSAIAAEAQLLQMAGLSPLEVLQTMTINGAAVCRLPDVGTIEAGRRADLLVLGSDPTAHIDALQDLRYVIADGSVVDRPGSDQHALTHGRPDGEQ
ncbi:MAG: amidohydrolase family protein [Actinomycetota bacterium]|nr:amidohydrolase family protein [Actinomycetota bacterium]